MTSKQSAGLPRFFLLTLCVIALGACSMRTPGHVTLEKAQVTQEKVYDELMLSDVTEAYITGLGDHYRKAGAGPIDLTIVYDPQSKTSTAMKASRDAARIVSNLGAQGVAEVETNILPVVGHGDESSVLIAYQAYTAKAPDGCTTMPGYDNNELNIAEDYQTGCTLETIMAKQIARPKDMAGTKASGVSDGRRAAGIVDDYRSGEPAEDLGGFTASQ